MALRLVNKINRHFVNNVRRSVSGKRDTYPESEQAEEETAPIGKAEPAPTTSSEQYQVCRPRTTPVTRFQHEVQNEADVAKMNVAMQHLQPAMLPEYYKPPVDISYMYPDPVNENVKQSAQTRRFEESKTCKNVTLPLKAPKLASPFPDPVKVMHSHTVSDQEKADQMFAEARMLKSMPETSRQQSSVRTVPPSRSYSTTKTGKDRPCKKLAEGKKTCPRMISPRCPPPKDISCTKLKKWDPCTKKEAPYPSYSESCHEEPYNKPSECKMCPWKADEHPHFKPPKQKYHTSSSLEMARKGDCNKPDMANQRPCAAIEEKERQKRERAKQQESFDRRQKRGPKKKASAMPLLNAFEDDVILSGKASCKRPDGRRCRKNQRKKASKDRKEGARMQKQKPAKATASSLSGEMVSWLHNLKTEEDPLEDSKRMLANEGEDKGRCKKFPFQQCKVEKKKKAPAPAPTGKCPKKKGPKLVKDCPGEAQDECKKSIGFDHRDVRSLGYLMTDDKDKKKKCPRVNLGVCTKDDDEDDPCKRKRRGKTLICPDDLLDKKSWKPKKKKSCPVIPPTAKRPNVSTFM